MSDPAVEPLAAEDDLNTEAGVFGKITQDYDSYADAAEAGCKWVDQGRTKVSPADLVLYRR